MAAVSGPATACHGIYIFVPYTTTCSGAEALFSIPNICCLCNIKNVVIG